MSVKRMKMASIVGKYEMLDAVVSSLIDLECYHPELTAELMAEIRGFTHLNEENPYSGRLATLLDVFEECGVKPELAPVADSMTREEAERYLDYLHDQLLVTRARRAELQEQAKADEHAVQQLEHFETLHVDLDQAFACEFVKVRFGRLPAESMAKLKAYASNPYVLFFPCSSDTEFYWGMYVSPESRIAEVDRIFASLFFERLHIPKGKGTPSEALAELRDDLAHTRAKIAKLDRIIDEYFKTEHDRCMQLYSYLKNRSYAFEIRRYCARYGDSFLLMGWVPENRAAELAETLGRIESVDVTVDDPESIKKAVPPSLLRNAKPFRPFEMFVSMYGLPNYNEVDPTAFVAVTYTLLYGIMFADLGQGILLSIIGYLMYRIKGMAIGKILIPCGISGAVFGTLFGSCFGFENALNPLFRLAGFSEKPIDVIGSATMLMGGAIVIGVVLLLLAMAVNIVSCLKRRDLGNAIFGPNGVTGMVLYLSLIALILSVVYPLPVSRAVLALCGVVLPLILIFLRGPLGGLLERRKDWKPESIGDYCLENGAELFEVVLSYITNTISFLRVGAFVLVHTGMMMVFFSLAEMVGGVGYVVLIVFGNAFVMVLEGLLVAIQVLRLEFYEMFSRFFQGEGHAYEPLRVSADPAERSA